jgi:hypothetical protein
VKMLLYFYTLRASSRKLGLGSICKM